MVRPTRSWRRAARNGLLVLLLLSTAGTIVSAMRTGGGIPIVVGTVASAILGLFTLAVDIWTRFDQPDQPAHTPERLAENLADIVRAEWRAEARARSLDTSGVLRLTWTAADSGISDIPANTVGTAGVGVNTRARLDGRLDDGFNEAVTGLADTFASSRTGRLVILGEPGAGKTVLAVMLTLGLLQRPRTVGTRTPVLLAVSSWDPLTEGLEQWIVRTLADLYYSGRRDTPALLLQQDLLLPVLDGLDEIPETARRDAVRGINEALGRERPVVVTCRAAEYTDVIQGGSPVLRGAPVVQVQPVPVDEVISYLDGVPWPAGTDWTSVYALLRHSPHGDLATALSTPLMVSVARSIYQHGGGDPAELLDLPSRHAVEDLLLDRLVDVAFTPDRVPGQPVPNAEELAAAAAPARRWLTVLAQYLHRHRERELAWWELGPRLLSPWIAPAVGIGSGLALLTLSISTALAIPDGWEFGTLFYPSAAYTVLAVAIWYAVPAPTVGRLLPVLRGSVGRLWRGFAQGVALIAVLAAPILILQAVAISLTDGWTLSSTRWAAVAGMSWAVAAVLVGAALATHNWFHARSDQAARADPVEFLRQDRRSALVGAAIVGVVLAVGLTPGFAVAVVLGSTIGWAVTGWPGASDEADWADLWQYSWDAVGFLPGEDLAWVFLCVLVGLMSGLLVLLTRAWTRFVIARVVLGAGRRLPWRLMRFLADARGRGLLRQSGGRYQFRHLRLQERLVSQAAEGRARGGASNIRPTGTARRRFQLRRLTAAATAVIVALVIVVPLLQRLPEDGARLALVDGVEGVKQVLYSPDGYTLASISSDGVRIWDTRAPSLTARYAAADPGTDLDRLTFSPDGRALAAAGAGMLLWNLSSSRQVAALADSGPVSRVGTCPTIFSPDGRTMISWDDAGTAFRYSTTDGSAVPLFDGQTRPVGAAAYSPDDSRLLAVAPAGDGPAVVLDTSTGRQLRESRGNVRATSLHWMAGGPRVAGLGGGAAWLWNTETGDLLALPGQDHVALQVSPDGRRIATGGADGIVRLWDGITGAPIKQVKEHPNEGASVVDAGRRVTHLMFSPDGQLLAIGRAYAREFFKEPTGQLWNAATGDLFDLDSVDLSTMLFSPDGRFIAAATGLDDVNGEGYIEIGLWETNAGRLVTELVGHTGGVTALSFSADRRTLASASWDGSIRIWDLPPKP